MRWREEGGQEGRDGRVEEFLHTYLPLASLASP